MCLFIHMYYWLRLVCTLPYSLFAEIRTADWAQEHEVLRDDTTWQKSQRSVYQDGPREGGA